MTILRGLVVAGFTRIGIGPDHIRVEHDPKNRLDALWFEAHW